ncbi:unnamed protein product [Symbiodinium natans]|uniref:Uncharacterized protein n=1 Tax=Symbiodinium natans TaxID=878477 RepID=A0A812LCE1_9DINO|nr:unnamed protein product [Symbiodinium natans]
MSDSDDVDAGASPADGWERILQRNLVSKAVAGKLLRAMDIIPAGWGDCPDMGPVVQKAGLKGHGLFSKCAIKKGRVSKRSPMFEETPPHPPPPCPVDLGKPARRCIHYGVLGGAGC